MNGTKLLRSAALSWGFLLVLGCNDTSASRMVCITNEGRAPVYMRVRGDDGWRTMWKGEGLCSRYPVDVKTAVETDEHVDYPVCKKGP